jgi:hypothetical protein
MPFSNSGLRIHDLSDLRPTRTLQNGSQLLQMIETKQQLSITSVKSDGADLLLSSTEVTGQRETPPLRATPSR